MGYILLTGATGLLGHYLLRDLTAAGVPLAVLVRASRWESASQRVEAIMAHWEGVVGRRLVRPVVLEGDISLPRAGLSSADVQWLSDHCRAVCHSAASLTFYHEPKSGEPWRSNVQGTRHILEVCREAGITQLHHVSTAYVCGLRRDRVLESELDVGQELGNDYEKSKLTAETEVLAERRLERVTIYRPSIIVGDSQTGFTTSFHGFYTPLRLVHFLMQSLSWEQILHGNWLDALHLKGHERKNLVPVDWVSQAMVWLILHPELHGTTYHLTHPQPTTVADMLDAMGSALGRLALERREPAALPEPAMSADEMRASFRTQMQVYQSYWRDDPEFDSRRLTAAAPHRPCPAITHAVMDRLIRFAIEANFGWPRVVSPARPAPVRDSLAHWLNGGRRRASRDATWQGVNLHVSGTGGGQWHVTMNHGTPIAAENGLRDGQTPTCFLTSDTLQRIARGELPCEAAMRMGRLVIAGNTVLPHELDRLFQQLLEPSVSDQA